MKTRIILFFSMLIFTYLLGAFYSVSFDISNWEKVCRMNVIIFGTLLSLAVSTFPDLDMK